MLKKFDRVMRYAFVPIAAMFAIRSAIDGEAWYTAAWAFFAGAGFYDWLERIADRYYAWRSPR